MNRSLSFLCVALSLCIAGTLLQSAAAQEAAAKAAEGTLYSAKKKFTLSHAVAYQVTNDDDETETLVLLSDRPLPLAHLKQVLTENDGSDEKLDLRQPHVKLRFSKDGKSQAASGSADGTYFSGGDFEGSLKSEGGRVTGSAKYDKDGLVKYGFDLKFNAALFDPTGAVPVAKVTPQKLGVTNIRQQLHAGAGFTP